MALRDFTNGIVGDHGLFDICERLGTIDYSIGIRHRAYPTLPILPRIPVVERSEGQIDIGDRDEFLHLLYCRYSIKSGRHRCSLDCNVSGALNALDGAAVRGFHSTAVQLY